MWVVAELEKWIRLPVSPLVAPITVRCSLLLPVLFLFLLTRKYLPRRKIYYEFQARVILTRTNCLGIGVLHLWMQTSVHGRAPIDKDFCPDLMSPSEWPRPLWRLSMIVPRCLANLPVVSQPLRYTWRICGQRAPGKTGFRTGVAPLHPAVEFHGVWTGLYHYQWTWIYEYDK